MEPSKPKRRKKKPELVIIERKLGRERAWGLCYQGAGLIELEERMKPEKFLRTAVHELMHCSDEKASESKVNKVSNFIGKYLWKMGYRRIKE